MDWSSSRPRFLGLSAVTSMVCCVANMLPTASFATDEDFVVEAGAMGRKLDRYRSFPDVN